MLINYYSVLHQNNAIALFILRPHNIWQPTTHHLLTNIYSISFPFIIYIHPTHQKLTPFDKIRQKIFIFCLIFCLISCHIILFSLLSPIESLISFKDTSSIHFLFHIVQTTIISISSNSLALFLKLF